MSSSQFNGLLIKNFNLLTKQTGTMVCQIITPIICLGFVFLIQIIVQANITKTAYGVKFDTPIFFNLPIYSRLAYAKLPIRVTNCDEWYLFDFSEDTPLEDKVFFGENDGEPTQMNIQRYIDLREEEEYVIDRSSKNPNRTQGLWNQEYLEKNFVWGSTQENSGRTSSKSNSINTTENTFFNYAPKVKSFGMLKSELNVLQKSCLYTGKMSPYFLKAKRNRTIDIDDDSSSQIDPDELGKSPKLKSEKPEFDNAINEEIYNRLEALNKVDFNKVKQGIGLEVLPDGAALIRRANKNEFSYNLQVNDNKFPFYHKNNGVTLFRVYNGESEHYTRLVNVMNGALWVADLFNRAYMKMFHPELYVISGIQPMPFEVDNTENIQRIINLAGSTFYPLAISLLMPLFMYTIVLEKESKLVEIMKINGLKMTYYWLSLFTFNFIIYATTFIIFYLFGRFAFSFKLFTDTSGVLMLIIFFGWGFCQIGLAYFFQSFLSNARTSTSKQTVFLYNIYLFIFVFVYQ